MSQPAGKTRTAKPLAARLLAILVCAALPWGPSTPFAAEKPLVIFFGGYGANETDMRVWQQAAAAHPRYGKAFVFEAIPYPKDVDYSVLRVVEAASATIEEVVARIRAMRGRRVIVAGHSSGAAIAVNVVSRLPDSKAIKLISLDTGINTGLPPKPGSHPIRNLECWSADAGELRSVGYKRTQELCKANAFVLHADHCATPICLHFYVVNRRAGDELNWAASRELSESGVSGGYRDLSINLSWLDRSM